VNSAEKWLLVRPKPFTSYDFNGFNDLNEFARGERLNPPSQKLRRAGDLNGIQCGDFVVVDVSSISRKSISATWFSLIRT
jgi:hypothetical protein